MPELDERQRQALENLRLAIKRCNQEHIELLLIASEAVSVLKELAKVESYKTKKKPQWTTYSNQTLIPKTHE